MSDANNFMKNTADGHDPDAFPPRIATDRPTAARCYDFTLGGKDNFAVDREFCLQGFPYFPESLDIAHENRRFLYRAVRYLAGEAGIKQFLDLGSGLPTQNNVHEVAQAIHPEARVAYVDHDPIVLAHGRALLATNDHTTVIQADMTEPESVLEHEDTRRLIDFDEPLAVLMFSIPHHIPNDEAALRAIHTPMRHAAPGSYLAITLVVADDAATVTETTELANGLGMPWKTRLPGELDVWLADYEPVEPGLCDINTWRPDPDQPPLPEVDPALQPFLGASKEAKRIYEYGGVLRKP